ncbi:MAG: PorT family protein [Hymenobacter sp.]|nr:MAG: PorT family protein [Hymenobacter sp.]
MKTPPILTLAAILLIGAAAHAQTAVRFGMRSGAGRAITTLDPASNYSGTYPFSGSADKAAIFAWQAGVVLEASFGQWAVQPALLFSQKGEKLHAATYASGVAGYNTQETTSTNRYNWLELPLNVVYTLHGDHGLQLFAGPYVALAVGGRQRGTREGAFYGPPTYSVPSTYASEEFDQSLEYGPSSTNQRFDAGLQGGVGYRQGPVQVQLGYSLGLLNLHHASDQREFGRDVNADAAYNRGAQLTGTYFFNL